MLMTDNELLLAIYDNMQTMKDDLAVVKNDVEAVKSDVASVKGELEIVKRDVKHLKKQAIRLQAMDDAILDEVERVHHIIIDHKADKTVHTA